MVAREFILLFGVINLHYLKAFRVFESNGIETILAMEDENIKIQCKADMPMAYCGFIHPNGTRYSFSGVTLDAGQCAIEIKAAKEDSGEWRCHIGGKGSIGVEVMQYIHLRVVEQLATLKKNLTTVHRKEVTLACVTTKGLTPLRYCRFEPPNGKPFSINSDVNSSNPILGRYYFPKNKSLDRGDCAVTIRKVKYEDVGTWACGAGLDDGKEHVDTITLYVEGFYTMSTASATGVTFGAIAIAAFLAILGFIVWKKRRLLGSSPDEAADEQELRHLSGQRTPRGSIDETSNKSPRGSRHASPRGSRHASPRGSRHASPRGSRHASPRGSRHASPHGSPRVSPKRQRHHSKSRESLEKLHKSPQRSPRDSSHISRVMPIVTIESPSDKGSPFTS